MRTYSTVSEFLADLDAPRREQVEALRAIILEAEPTLSEHIKWNSPSYVFEGEDRITFNLHGKDGVRVILHAGATLKEEKGASPVLPDDAGLLSWNSNIRATAAFRDMADIETKSEAFAGVVKRWLALRFA